MNLAEFKKTVHHEVVTVPTDELVREIEHRKRVGNRFPLDVFSPNLKPYIQSLNHEFDIPASYIGLTLLTAYSTAIGSAYAVTTNKQKLDYMVLFGALNGMTSSGKSMVIDIVLEPLMRKQQEFDAFWEEHYAGLSDNDRKNEKMETVLFRDVVMATLMRSILPDNPKGMIKLLDEIMEWINGMNPNSKKEGTDEQVWLSVWNSAPYSGIRSGKNKFSIPRPFINLLGGIQPKIVWKMFQNDRDTTGFIFRVLFANLDTEQRIAQPNEFYKIPTAYKDVHENALMSLYNKLTVDRALDPPKYCMLQPDAIQLLSKWKRDRVNMINAMEDDDFKEIHAGILGKMTEYAKRFSGILYLMDKSTNWENPKYENEEYIDASVMERALSICNYFYQSALDVHASVESAVRAPADHIVAANLFKNGFSYSKIGKALYKTENAATKKQAERLVQVGLKKYPRLYGSKEK